VVALLGRAATPAKNTCQNIPAVPPYVKTGRMSVRRAHFSLLATPRLVRGFSARVSCKPPYQKHSAAASRDLTALVSSDIDGMGLGLGFFARVSEIALATNSLKGRSKVCDLLRGTDPKSQTKAGFDSFCSYSLVKVQEPRSQVFDK
jgi:hypothetical protein